jgi:hypothetical protein
MVGAAGQRNFVCNAILCCRFRLKMGRVKAHLPEAIKPEPL